MKLEKLSAFAEIVSSVAIVVTLAYLAVQTQQNTAALRSNARQQTLASELELLKMQLEYPEAGPGDEDLTTSRRFTMAIARIRMREHDWIQFQEGQLDEAAFQPYMRTFIGALRQDETLRRALNLRGYHSGFVAFIDAELADDPSEGE